MAFTLSGDCWLHAHFVLFFYVPLFIYFLWSLVVLAIAMWRMSLAPPSIATSTTARRALRRLRRHCRTAARARCRRHRSRRSRCRRHRAATLASRGMKVGWRGAATVCGDIINNSINFFPAATLAGLQRQGWVLCGFTPDKFTFISAPLIARNNPSKINQNS